MSKTSEYAVVEYNEGDEQPRIVFKGEYIECKRFLRGVAEGTGMSYYDIVKDATEPKH